MEIERIHFETIDSTQDFAKKHDGQFDPKKITCITAGSQTAGRGRIKGRSWVSNKGNLHMTLFFVAPFDPNLAQIVAFSVAKVLERIHVSSSIKWPNDLLHQGEKICGCMVETTEHGLIIGIGLNVNAPIETDQPATSLFEITKKTWDLEPIAINIIEEFLKNWKKGFQKLRDEFEHMLAYKGEKVRVHIGKEQIEGIYIGITKKGHLQIQKENGTIVEILSGEIQRLRKS